jgi:CheY-like chemotaxis protein
MPHKLLLADDSVTIQRVIELTFADEDVQVIAVGDGKQAINRAQQDPPDIILADVGMPERDGYEVATFIKQTPELKHIPVLLLTGAFEPIDEGRARAAGCDGVLVKPFEPQLVINRVKDLISGRRSQPAAETPAADVPAAVSSAPVSAPPQPMVPASSFAADASSAPRPSGGGAPAGSIEDYFDRLDAAFSTLDTGAALSSPPPAPTFSFDQPTGEAATPAFGGLGDALAGWDPDITGDPSRNAPVFDTPPIEISWAPTAAAPPSFEAEPEPVASPAPPPSSSFETVAPAPQRSSSIEQPSFQAPASAPPGPPSLAEAFAALLAAEQGRPFSPAASAPVPVDERAIEEVTRRVLDRMSDRVVKETVVDLAERLVREEIDRIKSHAR